MNKIDILNRNDFVEKLMNLTYNISDNKASTSFAIDGTWGCGKSFVLDMYEEQLNLANDRFFVIKYNCWKYDYYEEPLVAIVAAMIDIINVKTKLWNDEEKKRQIVGVLKAVGASFLSIANEAVKNKTGIDVKQALEIANTGLQEGSMAYEKAHEYDTYFSFKQALSSLQNLLNGLSEDSTIVFLVDELDRCSPEYAIKVLERLHHLTENATNTITVISIDKEKLQESISHNFGFKQPEKYLEKFIKFEISLDKGHISEKFTEKHADYIDLFDRSLIPYDDSIEEFFTAVFQLIDARKQEQLMHRAKLAHEMLFSEKKDFSFMCAEVLVIVISECYDDNKRFSEWFNDILGVSKEKISWPPFEHFFNEKLRVVKQDELIRSVIGEGQQYIISITDETSLYGAIMYIWCKLFFNNKNKKIELACRDIRNVLDSNVEDLKKYIETLKFIK